MARPVIVALAAGAAHSSCLTRTGAVLTWRSADPGLAVQVRKPRTDGALCAGATLNTRAPPPAIV